MALVHARGAEGSVTALREEQEQQMTRLSGRPSAIQSWREAAASRRWRRSGGSRGASTRGRSGYEGPVGGGGASGEAAAGG